MLSHSALLTSFLLPALALAAPRQPAEERAGAAIGGVFAGAPISNITVKADNVAQCQTATISWTGATDPVSLFIALGGLYVGETPITTLYDLRGGSTTWLVNQAAGQTMEFRVTDAKGVVSYVQNIKIGAGDSWCLGSTTSSTRSSEAWSQPALTEGSTSTWYPPAETTTSSTQNQAAPIAATFSSTSTTSTRSTTSSTRSSTTTTAAPTPVTTFGLVSPPTTITSANSSASIAGAGAAASSSKTGGAPRGVDGRSGVVAALAAGAMVLGLTL